MIWLLRLTTMRVVLRRFAAARKFRLSFLPVADRATAVRFPVRRAFLAAAAAHSMSTATKRRSISLSRRAASVASVCVHAVGSRRARTRAGGCGLGWVLDFQNTSCVVVPRSATNRQHPGAPSSTYLSRVSGQRRLARVARATTHSNSITHSPRGRHTRPQNTTPTKARHMRCTACLSRFYSLRSSHTCAIAQPAHTSPSHAHARLSPASPCAAARARRRGASAAAPPAAAPPAASARAPGGLTWP